MGNGKPLFSGSAHLSKDPEARVCCWGRCSTLTGDNDIPLCREHHFRAWHAWQQNEVDAIIAGRQDRAAAKIKARAPRSVVYFARFGDRIKIGTTTNLKQRRAEIPHDEWLLSVSGGRREEQQLHVAFAHLRVVGEWFRIEPDLLTFIEELRPQAV